MSIDPNRIIPVVVSDITEAIVKVASEITDSFVDYPVPIRSVYSGPNPIWRDYYCRTFPKSRMLPPSKN